MDSLRGRVKNKEVSKQSSREKQKLLSLLHKIKQYEQTILKLWLTSPRMIPNVESVSRIIRPLTIL